MLCATICRGKWCRISLFFMEKTKNVDRANLARIDPTDDPVDLFKVWRDEAIQFHEGIVDVCCVATSSKHSKISSRNLLLREFDNDGFVIMTDARSRKVDDMEHNPYVTMCFLWIYKNDKQHKVMRQVRIEGSMKKLEKPAYEYMYEKEPLYCKIRSYLCHQDQLADWDDLNRRYNEILAEAKKNGENLPMPDHYVAYKLAPEMMEFYYGRDELIADRIRYENSTRCWEHQRIAA
ncbi:PREDICTED: pyridoxine/pyridoxamine 5'-phosphate oxidase-like isoform X1 [Dinoponera quadriceps]|uniref:pyridoxal 5'-phosphate synthase n=1 Tax=Dinoponera quadriceps TaxID=609295 RepID=A0A6P3WSU9_DINQU|nr:PREDICTED: pyridoxine/pyridoxamine 5'-phosphate oxidase-like isoform X1 [Dinoponera quadriceps]